MAQTLHIADSQTAELAELARDAKAETKRLGRQARNVATALAKLESHCKTLGIKFEVEPNPTTKERHG